MSELAGPSLLRSRFVLLERPLAHPGNCRICGAVDRPVIDFGADDDRGAVYFCTHCLTEVAKGALNLVDASDLDEARLTVRDLEAKLNTVGENTRGYIANLRNLYDDYVHSLNSVPSVDNDENEGSQSEELNERSGEISDSSDSESDADKSSSIERPVGLSATNGSSGSIFGNI